MIWFAIYLAIQRYFTQLIQQTQPELQLVLDRLQQKEIKWWQKEVIYQVYPKSFKDSKGTGMGDLRGVIEKMDYFKDGTENSLGVDAIWLSPFFKSPQYDSGYDISDYKDVDPIFGTMKDFEELVKEAHKRGIRIVLDFVGNHSSDEHPWFIESRSSRTNPKADWYYWRDPKPDGSPPNNWINVFGGSSWTYDEKRKQYYLHDFTLKQPNLNWRNPEVEAAMFDVLRFWISKGADAFRLDAVAMLMKNKNLPDETFLSKDVGPIFDNLNHSSDTDDPDIHPLLKRMHKVVAEFPQEVALYGELLAGIDSRNRYVNNPSTRRELNLASYFGLMESDWNQNSIIKAIKRQEKIVGNFGWPTYTLTNHDRPRIATRVGKELSRASAMLLLTLKGTPTIYYGDEIGKNNTNVPLNRQIDPQIKKDPTKFCRDYVRTPMQWNAKKNAGFSTADEEKLWLPIEKDYKQINVEVEQKDPRSIWNLHKRLLKIRKENAALYAGEQKLFKYFWINVFGFRRFTNRNSFVIIVNLGKKERTVSLDRKGVLLVNTLMDREGDKLKSSVKLRGGEGVLIKEDSLWK